MFFRNRPPLTAKTAWARVYQFVGINAFAAIVVILHECREEYLNFQNVYEFDNIKNVQFQRLAAEIFTQMGANINTHPIEVSLIKKTKSKESHGAIVHHNFFRGTYQLKLDPDAFQPYEKKGTLISNHDSDYISALIAHEAVHAIENHDFLNVYLSSLVAVASIQLCIFTHMRLQLALMCIVGPVTFVKTSYLIGQQFEYRADRKASEKKPEYRDALISIFKAMASKKSLHPPRKSLLEILIGKDHPTPEQRQDALLRLSKT